MGKSLIIIGKGYSVTRCTKKFVDSHDEVCIINSPVYDGYEHLISNHADYLFTNKTGITYTPKLVGALGLKKMFFSGHSYQKFQRLTPNVDTIYPSPNLYENILSNENFKASTGIQALTYFINLKDYEEISIVGFDFHEIGTSPYYYNVNEAHPEMRYLWNNKWKNNIINEASGHGEVESINYMDKLIKENNNISFKMISNNKRVNLLSNDNCKNI